MTNSKWVAAWANAMSIAEHKPEAYAKNITLRYPILAPFAASAIRITYDNFCGTEPITITKSTISIGDGKKNIDTARLTDILFDGKPSVTILPGQKAVSDVIDFDVIQKDNLSISFYLEDFTQMQSAVYVSGPLSRSWFSVGDHTCVDMPLEMSKPNNMVYFLSQVDFLTSEKNHAVVCFGDSITAQGWPDELALITYNRPDNDTAIIRRAASGCRILRQYSCLTYDSYGLKADIRFEHEFPICGADTIIIQEGINDIIHPVGVEVNPFRPWEDMPTLDDLIKGMTYCVEKSHSHNMKVYLGELLPFNGWRTYAPFREELREKFNEWIRTYPEADGHISFGLALCKSDDQSSFVTDYDSGDHLHPSSAGYKAMAEAAAKVLKIK